MDLSMGPVLSFRGVSKAGAEERWELSALVVADSEPAALRHSGAAEEVSPQPLWTVDGRTAYRYSFSAALGPAPSVLTYEVLDKSFDVHVPAAGRPPRMVYESCNGFSSAKEMKAVDTKFAMWTVMAAQHAVEPFHLLLQGGDQVYADSLWDNITSLHSWNELSFDEANEAPAPAGLDEQLRSFYFGLYEQRWSQPEMAEVLARVPSIAMWDDHDLIDGFGSYPAARQNSPVFQAIGRAATSAFAVFQQHLAEHEKRSGAIAPELGFSFGYVVGSVAVLAVDMRSQRTEQQVLTLEHWDAVFAWMDQLESVDHLVLMSSIPVVYPGFDTLERLLGAVPGQQELEDDLRDHWNSRPHKAERLRLIHRLLDLPEQGVRPTILSGDVHVAALGVIESTRRLSSAGVVAINQLISSAIVHPGPGGAVLFALRHLFDNSDEIDRGIVGRMCDFPGTQSRFAGGRNFLTLDPDPPENDKRRVWAKWFVERDPHPYAKVIHPAGPEGD